MQRVLYLGADTTTPVAWGSLSDSQKDELSNAGQQLPLPLLKNIYFDSGSDYLRFDDWSQFISHVNKHQFKPPRSDEIVKAFKGKDKAYGLNKPREKYAGQGLVKSEYYTTDTINKAIGVSDAKPTALHVLTDGEAQEYAEWFYFHPRYGPAHARKAGAKGEAPHGVKAEMIKKSCKAAISFTTTRQSSMIHFELSGIDLGAVVGKRNAGGWGITDAELRYIYRQMLRGGSEVDLRRVRFYLRGEEVAPPWVSEPALWAKYVPKDLSTKKQSALLPTLAEYKKMKEAATLPGKHGMLSSKNYGKRAAKIEKAIYSDQRKIADNYLGKLIDKLREMDAPKKPYWASSAAKTQFFDPLFNQVKDVRSLI